MENMELLKAVNEELTKLKEISHKVYEEKEMLKSENKILDSIISCIPTERLCTELKLRNHSSLIEVDENDKILISTSKGIAEFVGKKIIFVVNY